MKNNGSAFSKIWNEKYQKSFSEQNSIGEVQDIQSNSVITITVITNSRLQQTTSTSWFGLAYYIDEISFL
jgi:hypothetical protein